MDIRRIALLGISFVLLFVTLAAADEIDERIARAHEQIEVGVRSGALSRPDAHRLKEQLNAHLPRKERWTRSV